MLWMQTFSRMNFHYSPPLVQESDVLLDTELSPDTAEFEKAMWAAMWKQNPHWLDPTGGWSSVFQKGDWVIQVFSEEIQ